MWSKTPDGLSRPTAVTVRPAMQVDAKTDRAEVARALNGGSNVVVVDQFSTGLAVLAHLKKSIAKTKIDDSFAESRRLRSVYFEASRRLLVPIQGQAIALSKAPKIGWLERLYDDVDDFLLPFPQVQGLNSSWQWYTKGIRFPVLEHSLYPFYATYFPTRFEHLELFDEWLGSYDGPLRSTVDVGTGCGVLTFQLLRHRAAEVWATDTNPNAIQSVREDLERTKLASRVRLAQGEFFAGFDGRADLIVINPPWLAGDAPTPIDTAIYYPPDFFQRFFEAAVERLTDEGRLVILFSNLQAATHPTTRHPIEAELERGRFVEVARLRRTVKAASKKTKRPKRTGRDEHVELWELARNRRADH